MTQLLLKASQVDELKRELFNLISEHTVENQRMIQHAVELASKLHENQKRASGEPYIVHPLNVGGILAGLRMDAATISAGILHDVLEDTAMTKEELARETSPEVAELVDGVTKIHILHAKTKSLQEVETVRKMFLAMANDIRVIMIKLADKVHNMSTLEYLSDERKKRISTECLDLYAPLAGRLGMNRIRATLEDLALKHLDFQAYQMIEDFVKLKETERENFLQRVAKEIRSDAAKDEIQAEVQWRSKHYYSIYAKCKRKGTDISEIHDILGARVLVETVSDCYAMLGLIHTRYKPIEGRFKDYIAMPKENGYQSLHTTVMIDGFLTEIQIRTRQMHQTAEFGIAAHWVYKEGSSLPKDIEIFRRLREWSQSMENSADFMEGLKEEFLKDTIYVFTPKGKVIQLPKGATAIDFAYAIHTEVGNHCYAAKADGAIIPLHQELKNTQVIEIITAQNARPHLNWLRYARTSRARGKIRHWLTHNDPNILVERQVVAKKNEPKPAAEKKPETLPQEETVQRVTRSTQVGIRVGQMENLLIKFANCCKPLPGDRIVGFVSRGRGIIIHKESCPNIKNIQDFDQRKIEIEWDTKSSRTVRRFRVMAKKSVDLFSQIESAVRKLNGRLLEGRLEEDDQNRLIGTFTMELDHEDDAAKVIKSIRSIPMVSVIQRID